jgi:arylsulfatase A-like enzyme
MFTGLYPRRNGVTGTRFTMPKDVATLAELLSKYGYATGAVVTNSLLTTNGLDRGFDFHEEVDKGGPHPSATSRRGIEWLQGRDRKRPFFLLLHYIDPHADACAHDHERADASAHDINTHNPASELTHTGTHPRHGDAGAATTVLTAAPTPSSTPMMAMMKRVYSGQMTSKTSCVPSVTSSGHQR